jgi:hypothetical protein
MEDQCEEQRGDPTERHAHQDDLTSPTRIAELGQQELAEAVDHEVKGSDQRDGRSVLAEGLAQGDDELAERVTPMGMSYLAGLVLWQAYQRGWLKA